MQSINDLIAPVNYICVLSRKKPVEILDFVTVSLSVRLLFDLLASIIEKNSIKNEIFDCDEINFNRLEFLRMR